MRTKGSMHMRTGAGTPAHERLIERQGLQYDVKVLEDKAAEYEMESDKHEVEARNQRKLAQEYWQKVLECRGKIAKLKAKLAAMEM